MLVLRRQVGEAIIIGKGKDAVRIEVLDIRCSVNMGKSIHSKWIKLGIEANKSIPIHREEVYDAIQKEGAKTKNESINDQKIG